MNFFKSVFTDDDSTLKPESESDCPKQKQLDPTEPSSSSTSEWSLGGLMKTLATRSESVIETYSRDLKEFGSGLKKEIQVAQGSLNTVTHVIDEFGNTVIKGTAQIISQGKDAILAVDLDSSDTNHTNSTEGHDSNLHRKYSRFDAQLRVVQSDVSTYCEDPYDLDDYTEWKSGFVLDAENNKDEIERLVAGNRDVGGMFRRFVPGTVDFESFWCRYFYKAFKLRQAEDMRARLVKRAFYREEEELSWDVDDSESDEELRSGDGLKVDRGKSANVYGAGVGGDSGKSVEERCNVEELKGKEVDDRSNLEEINDCKKTDVVQNEDMGKKESGEGVEKEEDYFVKSNVEEKAEGVHEESDNCSDSDNAVKESVAESSSAKETEENVGKKGDSGFEKKELDLKSDEQVPVQGKADDEGSRKDSDVSVVSSQPSQTEEEDLGWDEIEDLSCIDDKKATEISSPKRAELRQRLSAADDEEDLSWDIEDDD